MKQSITNRNVHGNQKHNLQDQELEGPLDQDLDHVGGGAACECSRQPPEARKLVWIEIEQVRGCGNLIVIGGVGKCLRNDASDESNRA